jgi:hypothetical protein
MAVSAEDLSAAKAAKKAAKEAEKQAKKEAEKQAAKEAKAADKQAKAADKQAKAADKQAKAAAKETNKAAAQPVAVLLAPTTGANGDAQLEKKGKGKKRGKQPVAVGGDGVSGGSNGTQEHSNAAEVDHA